jgi:FAD/FMN-containing dehydrogenase
MVKVDLFAITHPAATVARGIENLLMYGERSHFVVKGACAITARLVSAVAFPIILSLELIFLRIPKMLLAVNTEKSQQKVDKAFKYFLAICPSVIFGLYCPEAVPGFFLKRPNTDHKILPFGVERIFGKAVKSKIQYPQSAQEVCRIVTAAKTGSKQVCIIGAGMSQGTQTIPNQEDQVVIHTKHLNGIQVNAANNTVTVGAGATWEEVQLALDREGKSAIVKQASDIFSIGGSIGINCHGWAHTYGAIAKTVRSLKMVDAQGRLRVLHRPNENTPFERLTDDEKLFKCMFGTLGYFGVVVEATLDIVDNVTVQEKTKEIDLDQFVAEYEPIKNNPGVPLHGSRLILDVLSGDPLRKVYMVSYHEMPNEQLLAKITKEPKNGLRLERIGLKLISHLSNFSTKRLISYFWGQEKIGMFSQRKMTRNQALHPPINAFKMMHQSDCHAQWLQEYFIEPDKLANFIRFLGAELKANDVRLINATISPKPKDAISILPYAEKERYAVVICFAQQKTPTEIAKTKQWIENVNAYLAAGNGVFYQAYMPYATREQFEACYGAQRVEQMRILKQQFDPDHVFGNAHTAKYYDRKEA